MKITCITPVFPPIRAGMARAAFEIAKHIGTRAEVTVLAPVKNPRRDECFELTVLKPFGRLGYGSFHPFIGRALQQSDIVLLHYPFFGAAEPLAAAALLPHRAKLVIWYHMDPVGSGLLRPVFAMHQKTIAPLILKFADAFVYASEDYITASAHAAEAIFSKPHAEIPFGVDDFFRQKSDVSRVINHAVPCFGFVGGLDRAHAFKGVEVLLRAFRAVSNEARLLIIGGGDRRNEFEALSPAGVRFVGSVSDEQLREMYRLMDVLVLPSLDRSEAFGLVAAEAMAAGVPVIVSDIPGLRSVMGPGDVCGVRVEAGNEDALVSAFENVISNRARWKERGNAAAQYAGEHYRWDCAAEKFIAFCRTL